jgi:hypothetical protein
VFLFCTTNRRVGATRENGPTAIFRAQDGVFRDPRHQPPCYGAAQPRRRHLINANLPQTGVGMPNCFAAGAWFQFRPCAPHAGCPLPCSSTDPRFLWRPCRCRREHRLASLGPKGWAAGVRQLSPAADMSCYTLWAAMGHEPPLALQKQVGPTQSAQRSPRGFAVLSYTLETMYADARSSRLP